MSSFILTFYSPHKVSFLLECWQCFPFITDFKAWFWGILVCIFLLLLFLLLFSFLLLYCTSWACSLEDSSYLKICQPYFLKYFSGLSSLWGDTSCMYIRQLDFSPGITSSIIFPLYFILSFSIATYLSLLMNCSPMIYLLSVPSTVFFISDIAF